jgi:peptidoglycan-associated lipoprotein
MGVKRIILASLVAMALPFMMTGCQKKGAFPNCKKDADCRVDATGAEINGVCYMGKCEECSQDSDCSDLKQCVNNRCLSACQADADCGADKHCENSYCIANCTGNEGCPGSHECVAGRCIGEGANGLFGECKGIERIHFDFDRYEVKPEYQPQVDRLAQCLEKNPGYSVQIEGHTDDRGTPSYNMALGQRRATAVQKYLKSHKGIASKQVKTQSYGDQRPLSSESTEYGWQQNRRADFVLKNN